MRFLTTVFAFSLVTAPAFANDFAPALEAFLNEDVRGWSQSDEIVAAIKAQNAKHAGLSQPQIDDMDKTWRANVGDTSSALIAPVLNNAAADTLRLQIEKSGGQITEIFLMDEHGLNVAASGVTSDMWQGDEAKFQKTFGIGPDGQHFGEVELDESTQTYQGQISLTIVDPATGAPIGAMTVGVDAESLL